MAGQGLVYQTHLPNASIGATVLFSCENGEESEGEVVSLNDKFCYCIPYLDLAGINRHTKIFLKSLQTQLNLSDEILGKVVDYAGNPLNLKKN